MDKNIDLIGQDGNISGEVAAYAAGNSKMNPSMLRPYISEKDGKAYLTVFKGGDSADIKNYSMVPTTNATLRRDEWKQLDEVALRISESRLNGIADLVSNGLVYNIGNGMGTTVLEWHDVSDAMEADLTMDGVARSKGDRPKYTTNYLPLPIIHVDYEINKRVLEASRSLGNPLDVTGAERAARKVSEKLESMLFTSTSYKFGGGTIYSYLSHPDRNQVTLSVDWDASAKTPKLIVDDVRVMKQAAIDAKHYGPFMLYIPTGYETVLDDDYDGTRGNTIRERILAIANIKGIKVVDTLTANNVLLVQMTSDVVRLVKGMAIQNVEWKEEGQFVSKFKVMTIQVPQVRSDQDGNSGIVHLA